MEEIYKTIEKHPNYEVSNLGNIRYKDSKHKKHLSLVRDRYMVSLNGKSYYVHIIVAEAFVVNLNPNKYFYVNHKDENPLNNKANNLEWCTQKYNVRYGTCQQRRVEKISKGKIFRYNLKGELIEIYPSLSCLYNNNLIAIWHRIIRHSKNRFYDNSYWIKENENLNDFINTSKIKKLKLQIL